jgi:hypothetical protein
VNADAHAHAQPSRASAPMGTHLRDARAQTPATHRDRRDEPPATQANSEEVIAPTVKDINKQMAAYISWSRTADRTARTRPAREAFLRRFERQVDPDGVLVPAERGRRAQHALRAHMLRLAKRSVTARRQPRYPSRQRDRASLLRQGSPILLAILSGNRSPLHPSSYTLLHSVSGRL